MGIINVTMAAAPHHALYFEAETIISMRVSPSMLTVTTQKNLSAASHNIHVKHLEYILQKWGAVVHELLARQMLELDSEGFKRWMLGVFAHDESVKGLFLEHCKAGLVMLGEEADKAEAAAKKKAKGKTG